jgi:hypothetical protein
MTHPCLVHVFLQHDPLQYIVFADTRYIRQFYFLTLLFLSLSFIFKLNENINKPVNIRVNLSKP